MLPHQTYPHPEPQPEPGRPVRRRCLSSRTAPVSPRSVVDHSTCELPTSLYDNRTCIEEIPPKKLTAGAKRNAIRLERRNRLDRNLLCKSHLPNNLSDLFGPAFPSPDDEDFIPPAWLLQSIQQIAATSTPTPAAPPFQFCSSSDSVTHNTRLLEEYDFDLTKIVDEHQHTTLGYGSEFRSIEDLSSIYRQHELFSFFKVMHQKGMEYIFKRDLTEDERMAELEANIARGNHASAKSQPKELERKVDREVTYGFALPVWLSAIPRIPRSLLQACGLVTQSSLSETGERIEKSRLTHDQSFCITSNYASVNRRLDRDAYPDLIYGFCLLRIIHFIVALRLRFPDTPILISKYDFSDAYRRISHRATSAVQTIIALGLKAYIMLVLSFGGAANPQVWCGFSEMLCDLSNEIPLIPNWDPEVLFSPSQPVVPLPDFLPEPIRYAKAQPMAVEVPTRSLGRGDCYLDDIIKVYVGIKSAILKHAASAPLAMFVSMRPLATDEPVPRKETLSLPKLKAEGTPSEMMIVLGWWLDTRRLLLRLPNDKFVAYSKEVEEILDAGKINGKDLEHIIGVFVHTSYAVPLSRHFLDNFRFRLQHLKKINPHQAQCLNRQEICDFVLWKKILAKAHEGVSLNGLTFRMPTRIGFSDSCPLGLGGLTHGGRGWRLKVNPELAAYGKDISNNLLEFLGMAITLWLSLDECRELNLIDEMILILGDNTSAISWIFKSGLQTASIYRNAVLFIARKIATLVIDSKNFIDSQHLPGVLNLISDWLTFEGTSRIENGKVKLNPIAHDCPSNEVATNRILSAFPQLVPVGFRISPLPKEILSFACQALLIFESSLTQRQREDLRTTTESGEDGRPSATSTWEDPNQALSEYPQGTPNSPVGHSLSCTESPILQSQEALLDDVKFQWWAQLSRQPSTRWV